jgi:hypothetical protein
MRIMTSSRGSVQHGSRHWAIHGILFRRKEWTLCANNTASGAQRNDFPHLSSTRGRLRLGDSNGREVHFKRNPT